MSTAARPYGAKVLTRSKGGGSEVLKRRALNRALLERQMLLRRSARSVTAALEGALECTLTPRGKLGYFVLEDGYPYWDGQRTPAEEVPTGYTGVLTGYGSASPAYGTSGPVPVHLSPAVADRLIYALDSLPGEVEPQCLEDNLIYTLELAPPDGRGRHFQVQGWVCGRRVNVTADGVQLALMGDRSCRLIDTVASIVPPGAAATRSWANNLPGCHRDR